MGPIIGNTTLQLVYISQNIINIERTVKASGCLLAEHQIFVKSTDALVPKYKLFMEKYICHQFRHFSINRVEGHCQMRFSGQENLQRYQGFDLIYF